MTLPALKQTIIDRWLSAYDEFIPEAPQEARKIYAPNRRFELTDYKNGFSEKRKLSVESFPEQNFIYILDESGRPGYFEHQRNDKVCKKGYYTYTDSLVEYIEYDVITGAPHSIQRITYEGDKLISFASLILNRTIDPTFHGTGKAEIMGNLLKDELALFGTFELYHYTDYKISHADCLYITPASGEFTLLKNYKYNEREELDEILDTYSDNSVLYGYVKTPDNTTLQQLSDQLAAQIAADIIKALKAADITTPIAILAINFQSVGVFSPLLNIFTAEDLEEIEELEGEEKAAELFSLDPEDIAIEDRSFERLLCAFMRETETLEDYDLAIAMARKAARLLNDNKLNNEIPITKNFIAYATDWDVEPEHFADVLKDCGVPQEEIDKWGATN